MTDKIESIVIKEGDMININIPGWANMEIENMVIDLNGTLAIDGKVSMDVKERINKISELIDIFVLTSDIYGTAFEECKGLRVKLIKIEGDSTEEGKFEFIKGLPLEKTVVIGNGNNDKLILKESALGIAVLGDEGLSISAIKNADIVVKNISDALDLFLKPKRLIATLRE